MAETEVVEVADDAAMFRDAVDAPSEQSKADRERDEKGRFVAKEPEQPAQAEQPAPVETPKEEIKAEPEKPKDDAEAQVPSWRLRELREARDAEAARLQEATQRNWQLETQLKQLQDQVSKLNQPKQEPVDWFSNPEAALNQHLTPVQQQLESFMQEVRLTTSRTAAIASFGTAAVKEMEDTVGKLMAQNHPEMESLGQRMRSSNDPAGVAMQWYKQHKLMETTGGDIDAYRAKVAEELLKDKDFIAKAVGTVRSDPQTKNVVNIPPSLSRAQGSGGRASVDDADDMSNEGLFKHATSGMRK